VTDSVVAFDTCPAAAVDVNIAVALVIKQAIIKLGGTDVPASVEKAGFSGAPRASFIFIESVWLSTLFY
jgi:hypothetical protein